ncbi:undecaprenyl-phosphate galactose phosphotransferase WbaP [Thalassoroseus pseudoceratinae]|uniref:undecaprenyl-phosphate galactose phosphotransferase WbaP n=1 Tax=Thalassoroseus pseudoceratinae TaxID=2713176 RepID=UPI00141E052A|nr:undecaprenyl-phosphate galactose phosphotransferase WbaP [Thalassoroseus pseudoceratinae]
MTVHSDTTDMTSTGQMSVVTRPLKQATEVAEQPTRESNGSHEGAASFPINKHDSAASVVPRSWQGIVTAAPLACIDMINVGTSITIASAVVSAVFGVSTFASAWGVIPVAALCYLCFGLYPAVGMQPIRETRQLTLASALAFSTVITARFAWAFQFDATLGTLTLAWALATFTGPPLRLIGRELLGRQSWWGQRALIIGGQEDGRQAFDQLACKPALGLRPVALLRGDTESRFGQKATDETTFGTLSSAAKLASKLETPWAVIAMTDADPAQVQHAVELCANHIPKLSVLSEAKGQPTLWAEARELHGTAALYTQHALTRRRYRWGKRAADMFLSGFGLLLISPFLLGIILAIKLRSPGPVFFGHERIGRGGRRFKVWKFRTMVVGANDVLQEYLDKNPEMRAEWERDHKLKNDPRIIKGVGNFLRKFSIDEIPQIWNILRGDMSLVGPRPIVNDEVVKYNNTYPVYLKVRPGLTGLWQISGRNNTTYEARVQYDDYYVRNWSPWLDIYILARTVKTAVLREGAY